MHKEFNFSHQDKLKEKEKKLGMDSLTMERKEKLTFFSGYDLSLIYESILRCVYIELTNTISFYQDAKVLFPAWKQEVIEPLITIESQGGTDAYNQLRTASQKKDSKVVVPFDETYVLISKIFQIRDLLISFYHKDWIWMAEENVEARIVFRSLFETVIRYYLFIDKSPSDYYTAFKQYEREDDEALENDLQITEVKEEKE